MRMTKKGAVDVDQVNVQIGEKKTYDDFGLRLSSIAIGFPEAKTNLIDIPGVDGSVDLTEALGEIAYKNRSMELVFDALGEYEPWHALCTQIANYLHGRRLKVILDTDPYYYYIGRLTLDTSKTNETLHEVVISGDMDPYKYELLSSMDEWLWDPFSFVDGVIRYYKQMSVQGSRTIRIPGRRKPVVPTITSSAAMTVSFEGKSYVIRSGIQKVYGIVIREGEQELVFNGTGTVSIDYRGGVL